MKQDKIRIILYEIFRILIINMYITLSILHTSVKDNMPYGATVGASAANSNVIVKT